MFSSKGIGAAFAAGFVCGALFGANAASAGDNPIFGKAHVIVNTATVNKHVQGKGYYADYYGYYGNFYSSLATGYGTIASYYKDAPSYYSAYRYSSYASQDYYNAYVYQSRGQ